jgi:SAM-dependent methyltransferase
MTDTDPDTLRADMLERWDRAAAGWGRNAEQVREHGMPVSMAMIQRLALLPGQRVLELAAGPGDTGLLAAELIKPGGTLVSSDASEAMLEIARTRANELGIENVEFKRLELEWIDLPTADVDAVLCRWGLMLVVDPEAAAREMRRVLRPGGRLAVAVWDQSFANPWATVPTMAMIELGHMSPPPPVGPGMFALAAPGALQELLESTGFVQIDVGPVELSRTYTGVDAFIEETLNLSMMFAEAFRRLDAAGQDEVVRALTAHAATFTDSDGSITFPGRSLVAAARA